MSGFAVTATDGPRLSVPRSREVSTVFQYTRTYAAICIAKQTESLQESIPLLLQPCIGEQLHRVETSQNVGAHEHCAPRLNGAAVTVTQNR
jgi:hypothetical protein